VTADTRRALEVGEEPVYAVFDAMARYEVTDVPR